MTRHLAAAAILVVLFLVSLPAFAGKLPSGTEMTVRLEREILPGSKHPENFSALLSYPVFVDGREVLPAGCRVEGEVRGSKNHIQLSPRYIYLPGGQRLDFNAAVRDIDRKKLRAEEKEGTIGPSGGRGGGVGQAAQVALTGAAIGSMAGGSAKAAGIGAAVGVAAVLIGSKVASRSSTSVIPAGTQLTLSLARPLELPDDLSAAAATFESRPAEPEDRRPVLRRNPQ